MPEAGQAAAAYVTVARERQDMDQQGGGKKQDALTRMRCGLAEVANGLRRAARISAPQYRQVWSIEL
jgi:hypothetical protein